MATFSGDSAWLPVGSDVARVDAEGNVAPTDTDLVRVDLATGDFTARVPLTGTGFKTFALDDSIVVQTDSGADVISTKTLKRERTLPGGSLQAFGAVWDIRNGTLIRINPKSGKITDRLVMQKSSALPDYVTAGAGDLWVGLSDHKSVVRIDPETMRRVTTIKLDGIDDEVVVGSGYGSVWANQPYNGTGKLYRIDPRTNTVATTVALGDAKIGGLEGRGGSNLAFSGDSVWTCDTSGTLTQVDAATSRVKAVRELPFSSCTWLAIGGGSAWVSTSINDEHPRTTRIELQ